MKRATPNRRRPVVHITLGRASRLHRLVTTLASTTTAREALLERLTIGLRTFYRELDLLKRCGIKVKRDGKTYRLTTTVAEAEGRLPFPDPQLSFSEMAELARHPGDAAKRLADLLATVVEPPAAPKKKGRKKKETD